MYKLTKSQMLATATIVTQATGIFLNGVNYDKMKYK